jgi:hypothetical protein
MLRVRLFPLRSVEGQAIVPGVLESGLSGENPGAPATANNFNRLDTKESVMKTNFFLGSCFQLYSFAVCACAFNGLALCAALIVTGLYESGYYTEKFDLRHPLTKTAVIWLPPTNASVVSNVVGGGSCNLFSSRKFFGQRDYTQSMVFDYPDGMPVRYPLAAILLVGFLFQLSTLYSQKMYLEPFSVGNSHITSFLERSISFPLFVVVLAVKVGISDVMAVLGLMFSAWAAMLFSFLAEILFQGDGGFLAFGPGHSDRYISGDTVKHSGGYWAWTDGNIHYHALSLFFSLANFGFVCTGLLHNFFLTDFCFDVKPIIPDAVKPVKLLVYSTLVLYGLILVGQVFVGHMKPKPSTKEFLISFWKQRGQYAEGSLSPDQTKELKEVLESRVQCALNTEFFNGVLDLMVKCLAFSSFFIFARD